MTENPLQVIEDNDPDFAKLLDYTMGLAFEEGTMPMKYKLLIAMALDASKGAENGVKVLAMHALEAGATKEEIMEAVRITHYISGVGSAYTAANALKDVL
ncbi:carboxymuconolactone decarboxylase family protein [Methanolobus sp. ZRKC3]|uniref:carboxymuconolactone decarboxylase family protein n=1 Tax=Methanolobus sp. ZRKC3 TaxID=3125786 RepID=UPI0032563CD0